MVQYTMQDDKIEYEKDAVEVSEIIIGQNEDGIKENVASYAQQFSFLK